MPESQTLTKAEFCQRFVAHILKTAGRETFDCGSSIREYAEETAPYYFEDELQSGAGPEDCAKADMSYWERTDV